MQYDRGILALALYVIAGASYISLAVFVPKLILSWVEGAAFLILVVWLVPALFRMRR